MYAKILLTVAVSALLLIAIRLEHIEVAILSVNCAIGIQTDELWDLEAKVIEDVQTLTPKWLR